MSYPTGILKMRANYHLASAFLAIMLLLFSSIAAAQTAVGNLTLIGEVALTKGVVTARSVNRPLTALAKGSPIYLGDIIETASRSFAVIKFSDGGKVTLRPDTRFDINEYDGTAGQEKQSFELLKGGLRAVTGAIGKAKPEEVTYTSRNTTIGIRGTTFVMKMCRDLLPGEVPEPGDNVCQVSTDADSESEIDSNKKYVDIFIIDKKGGARQRITRKQLRDLLQGLYVSVIEGSIRVSTPDWFIDLVAGDKCVVDSNDQGSSQRSSDEEVECFLRGEGVEGADVFLGAEAEKITVFNLFDDSEIFVGEEICEIN